MSVTLNHTIVPATDRLASARFLSAVLGVQPPQPWGPFVVLDLANDVSMDFVDAEVVEHHHYAFLVDEAEFDPIFGRIREVGVSYYADPFRRHPGEINRLHGGRGVYFDDPDGHLMEVITKPYGPEPAG